MASTEVAIKELNNLIKNKLVEIILKNTVPSEIKLNETTRKLVEYGENPKFIAKNSKISEINSGLMNTNNKLEYYKRLIAEMERSLSDQQVTIKTKKSLIKILKSNENNTCSKSGAATSKIFSKSSEHERIT